jgi:hypothetical protein
MAAAENGAIRGSRRGRRRAPAPGDGGRHTLGEGGRHTSGEGGWHAPNPDEFPDVAGSRRPRTQSRVASVADDSDE